MLVFSHLLYEVVFQSDEIQPCKFIPMLKQGLEGIWECIHGLLHLEEKTD